MRWTARDVIAEIVHEWGLLVAGGGGAFAVYWYGLGLGWSLFVLLFVWYIKSQNFNVNENLHLDYYITMLLLDEGFWEEQKTTFRELIREQPPLDASTLTSRIYSAIGKMADELAVGGSGGAASSVLQASAAIWRCKQSGEG
jgi:hypothetical protein